MFHDVLYKIIQCDNNIDELYKQLSESDYDPSWLHALIGRLNIEKVRLLTNKEREEVDELVKKYQEPSKIIEYLYNFNIFVEKMLDYYTFNCAISPCAIIDRFSYYMAVNTVLHSRYLIDAEEPAPKKACITSI